MSEIQKLDPTIINRVPSASLVETPFNVQQLEVDDLTVPEPITGGAELMRAPGLKLPEMSQIDVMAEADVLPGFGIPVKLAVLKNRAPSEEYGETLLAFMNDDPK